MRKCPAVVFALVILLFTFLQQLPVLSSQEKGEKEKGG